ncbi:microprocessor complex subunit DGCR8 [Nephila pilipes]|uniref:Microprocessor complex subunit DGCR8 n=1 Tax=Nephila pilipes TaxID=299642 RepID=A0A8X6PBB8_NEPPI|nr:microprocessor complex subunit DGCR8 [Nephila pilipes]
MCDSKEEIVKESVSKTSPLIIRLSTITSGASLDSKNDDTSKISKTSVQPPHHAKDVQTCLYKSSDLRKKENDLPEHELTFHEQSLKLESECSMRTVIADTLDRCGKLNEIIQMPEETNFHCNDIISKHYNSSVHEKLSKKDKCYSVLSSSSSKFNFSNFSDMLKGDQSLQEKKRKLSQDFRMKEEDQHISLPVEPPLVMQSSNLLSDDKLDFGHDGGGIPTSMLEADAEPLKKKLKYFKYKDSNPALCHVDHVLKKNVSDYQNPIAMHLNLKNELDKTDNQILDLEQLHAQKNELQERDNQNLPSRSICIEKILVKDETSEFEVVSADLPYLKRDLRNNICHEFDEINNLEALSVENMCQKSNVLDKHKDDEKDLKLIKKEILCTDAADITLLSQQTINKKGFDKPQKPVSFEGIINSLGNQDTGFCKTDSMLQNEDYITQKKKNESSNNIDDSSMSQSVQNLQDNVAIESSCSAEKLSSFKKEHIDFANVKNLKMKERHPHRKHRRYRSGSDHSNGDHLKKNDHLKDSSCSFKKTNHENKSDSSAVVKSNIEPSFLFCGKMDIDDDVGNLEITELEKIRESLRKQLLEDEKRAERHNINYSESLYRVKPEELDPSTSEHLVENQLPKCIDSIADNYDQTSADATTSKAGSDILLASDSLTNVSENCQSITLDEQRDIINQDSQCSTTFSNKQTSSLRRNLEFPSEKNSHRHSPETLEKNYHPGPSYADKKASDTGNDLIFEANEPPLVMQSSNLLLNNGLDIKHGRGGKETSGSKMDQNFTKELSLVSHKDLKDNDQSHIQNDGKATSNHSSLEERMVESDDSASNQASDSRIGVQRGIMEFDILDEFESDDNDGDEDNSDNDSDISTDEIDAMLEEGLMHGKSTDKNEDDDEDSKDIEHEEKEKVILKVRGRDHFDVLPEGWIEVTHNSGMPIYLHKQSRVCSVSKPYFLGPGSTRKHEIPVSAIPCLHYLRELEKEKELAESKNISGGTATAAGNVNVNSNNSTVTSNGNEDKAAGTEAGNGNSASNGIFLSAKLETVKDTKESGSLDFLAVREYCKKRFEFQTITVKRFRTWSGRRKHQKQIKHKQRPFLPDSTKLITCPLLPSDKATATGNNTKREFIMNPSGKSPVCILHEYVQHTLRVQPKYVFKELESASTPYGAVVLIENVEYGCGFGSSKKLAKSDAAKSALEILIPKMRILSSDKTNGEETQNVDFFDQVRVEDPRVCELSVKAGQPYPYQILLECLKRNYGMGDTKIQFMMKNLKHQKNEFFMKVGKHETSVVCKNKRDGKHRASQAILQKLHPHINSWGSLLRMYGKGSCKTMKEKKEEEQRITELQSQACVNKPNMSILNKLKEEMLKYREKVKSMKPIGKLVPERMEVFSTSSSNLKNVEL